MSDEIHLLIGFEAYYPTPDNTLAVFSDREEAERICDELKETCGNPDHKAIYADLREKYGWLPEYKSERYDVVTHSVDL